MNKYKNGEHNKTLKPLSYCCQRQNHKENKPIMIYLSLADLRRWSNPAPPCF